MAKKSDEERFFEKVLIVPGVECWEWVAARSKAGYGQFRYGEPKQMRGPHRFSYELFNGKIKAGLVIDHICRNRGCVNPSHLRPMSPQENTLLANSLSPSAINLRKTHCHKGHPLDQDKIRINKAGRVCRECRRPIEREYRRRVRAKNKITAKAETIKGCT